MWTLISAYLNYEEFFNLAVSCTLFSKLTYQWVIHDVLEVGDYQPTHKQFLFLFQDKIISLDPKQRFNIDNLSFHFYRSTPSLDSILFQIQPRVLILDFGTKQTGLRVRDNFITDWLQAGYRAVEELKIISMHKFYQSDLEYLKSLVKLQKVTISGDSDFSSARILSKLPRSIMHLTIDVNPTPSDPVPSQCPFCALGGLRNFRNLVELNLLATHQFGVKVMLYSPGVFPCLETLRIRVWVWDYADYPCSYGDTHVWGNIAPRCVFPQLENLEIHGRFPVMELLVLVGPELRYLSLIPADDVIVSWMVLNSRKRFPKFDKLFLNTEDLQRCRGLIPQLDLQLALRQIMAAIR